jgi:hypothetical protein
MEHPSRAVTEAPRFLNELPASGATPAPEPGRPLTERPMPARSAMAGDPSERGAGGFMAPR